MLSHWPHVATHVATQVAQLVANVKGLGHKLPNLLINVSECRKLRASAASSIFRRRVESHVYSLPIKMEFLMTSYSPLLLLAYSSVAAVTSLGIPFSDWLNETVSKMRLNLLLNNVSSVNGSIDIHGEYKFSNKFSNLCGNLCGDMWPVWKHYNATQLDTGNSARSTNTSQQIHARTLYNYKSSLCYTNLPIYNYRRWRIRPNHWRIESKRCQIFYKVVWRRLGVL